MKLPIPSPQICPPRTPGQTNFPHLSIQSALELEIPPHLIARKINEMLEATHETSFGRVQTDWVTVEAGLRLYLELTKRPMIQGISLSETTSIFPAAPTASEMQGRPNRQKQPLSRRNEDEDTLKNFMAPNRSVASMDEASIWEKEGSEFAVHWGHRSQTASDPFEQVCPAATQKNDYRLAMLSSVAIAGFLGILGAAFFTWNPTELSAQPNVAATSTTLIAAPAKNPDPEPKTPAPTGIAAFSPRFETKMW